MSDPHTPTPGWRPAPSRAQALRRFARLAGLTFLLCILIAAVLTLALPSLGSFWRNLWFSECIGLWVTGASALVYHLPPLRRLPPRAAVLLALLLGMPLGYVLGYATAYTVLGEPVRILGLSSARGAAITATLLAGGFVTYLAYLHHRLRDEEAARATAHKLLAEAQLRMLRAQLEPHMLFNTLANLRSLVDEAPGEAQRMIDHLITYFRGTLAGSRADTATLKAEFAQLEAYLRIMSLRLGARLRFEFTLPEELQGASLPSMLLQPLVENAVKHGIEPKIGGGCVTVHARRLPGALEIVVEDTGLGLPPDFDPERSSDSYGLVHVRDRLRALHGSQAELRLERLAPQGTRATVRIPT